MNAITGYVWCDWSSNIHEAVPDPESLGPRYPGHEDDMLSTYQGWEKKEVEGWPGVLWHFTCPGPHYKIYTRGHT